MIWSLIDRVGFPSGSKAAHVVVALADLGMSQRLKTARLAIQNELESFYQKEVVKRNHKFY
jgi:hypothetical protein